MDGWMDGWMVLAQEKLNSFSLEGLHETNQWRKKPCTIFLFFKKGKDRNPFTRSTRHFKSTNEGKSNISPCKIIIIIIIFKNKKPSKRN
jgi:hypothetical protein